MLCDNQTRVLDLHNRRNLQRGWQVGIKIGSTQDFLLTSFCFVEVGNFAGSRCVSGFRFVKLCDLTPACDFTVNSSVLCKYCPPQLMFAHIHSFFPLAGLPLCLFPPSPSPYISLGHLAAKGLHWVLGHQLIADNFAQF